MKPLDLLLMVHKSGDHQLRLVVETPLFTGWTTHPAGGFLAFLPSTAWPNKWCLLDFKISMVAILIFLFLTILKWSNSGAFKDLYHHLTLTPPQKKQGNTAHPLLTAKNIPCEHEWHPLIPPKWSISNHELWWHVLWMFGLAKLLWLTDCDPTDRQIVLCRIAAKNPWKLI